VPGSQKHRLRSTFFFKFTFNLPCTTNRCETRDLPGPEGGATTGEIVKAASTPGSGRRAGPRSTRRIEEMRSCPGRYWNRPERPLVDSLHVSYRFCLCKTRWNIFQNLPWRCRHRLKLIWGIPKMRQESIGTNYLNNPALYLTSQQDGTSILLDYIWCFVRETQAMTYRNRRFGISKGLPDDTGMEGPRPPPSLPGAAFSHRSGYRDRPRRR
jgi:hypothetical protein